jgi:lipid-binding SYLF domain-containing protein
VAQAVIVYLKTFIMKKKILIPIGVFSLLFVLLIPISLFSQSKDEMKLQADSKNAKAAFIRSDANMKSLFDNAYAYVIFPNVGKGGIGVGGAAGGGIAYEGGKAVGKAKMRQVSVGFQFGGQAYREVIFFENKAEFDRFKEGNYEFAAQASAIAVNKGASANVNYKNGVMVFTQEKKGVMYEASIGGQKFSFEPFKS